MILGVVVFIAILMVLGHIYGKGLMQGANATEGNLPPGVNESTIAELMAKGYNREEAIQVASSPEYQNGTMSF